MCVVVVMLCVVLIQERSQEELATLEKTIQERQKELDGLLPRYMQQKTEEEQLKVRSVAADTAHDNVRTTLNFLSAQIEGM